MYDIIYIGANFFPPPGAELRTYFDSAMADERGSANWPGIENPVVDALLLEVIKAGETGGYMKEILDRINQIR